MSHYPIDIHLTKIIKQPLAPRKIPDKLLQLLRTPTRRPEHLRPRGQPRLNLHLTNKLHPDARTSRHTGINGVKLHREWVRGVQ
jgi:hypothetical protein